MHLSTVFFFFYFKCPTYPIVCAYVGKVWLLELVALEVIKNMALKNKLKMHLK